MDNISFLTQVLTSQDYYWVVQKVNKYETIAYKGTDVSVWLICIPHSVRRGLKKEEILLTDLEHLRSIDVQNIALSDPYPPFQLGQTMYYYQRGFPLPESINQKEYLTKALKLNSLEYYDYKSLLDIMIESVDNPIQESVTA